MEKPKEGAENEESHPTAKSWLFSPRVRKLDSPRKMARYLEQILRVVWGHAAQHPKDTLSAADVANRIMRNLHQVVMSGELERELKGRMDDIEIRLAELLERQERLRSQRLQ